MFKKIRPKFWQSLNWLSIILLPLSLIYIIAFHLKKSFSKNYKAQIPVIVIGNIIAGGGGKTPIAIKVCEMLIHQGYKPCFLTRGYGGKVNGPQLVTENNSDFYGDEAILLSKVAPTIVSKNRALGAKYIESLKQFDVIIMDDGLQNFTLYQDCKILVVDGVYECGNKLPLPAGPMREIYKPYNQYADIVIYTNTYNNNQITAIYKLRNKLQKNIIYNAFCGIADPYKFFNLLEDNNIKLDNKIIYEDHYNYTKSDINYLSKLPNLLTTSKDAVKIFKLKFVEIKIETEINKEDILLQQIIAKIS
jgi:tetraacyldisaccharide 4'-kinase